MSDTTEGFEGQDTLTPVDGGVWQYLCVPALMYWVEPSSTYIRCESDYRRSIRTRRRGTRLSDRAPSGRALVLVTTTPLGCSSSF